jgi:hypothetical protein
MKNSVFWDITSCGSCKNRRLGGTSRLHHQGGENRRARNNFRSVLRVFENRVLRRIFGPKRDGVTGGCRNLYNEELHNLYSSPSIIRII